DRRDGSGDFARLKDAGPSGVVQVMVDIGDAVGEPGNLPLTGRRHGHRPRVVEDPVSNLPGQVQPVPLVLQMLDDPQALFVVAEGPTEEWRERLLSEVAEGGVAQVVPEGDRLDEVLVQPERPGCRPGDL